MHNAYVTSHHNRHQTDGQSGTRRLPGHDPSYELRAQAKWKGAGLFQSEPIPGRPKCFIVELPPFANGKLHLGHLRNYTIGDVVARFRRMAGYNVLYSTGFDTFGLPNENAAAEEACAPAALVERNMTEMRRQFDRLGLSYDLRRVIADHEPRFYRWVQYTFVKLLTAGHVYRNRGLANWCPTCRTTLADSLVDSGQCWRCATPIRLVEMERWYVREADFIEPLLATDEGLSGWPPFVKRIHRDWIGRREGIEISFRLDGSHDAIAAFTTSPLLLNDVAFLAVGPSHPLARRSAEAPKSRIVDLSVVAIEPLSERRLPIVLICNDPRVSDGEVALGCPRRDAADHAIWQDLGLGSEEPASDAPLDAETIIGALLQCGAGRPAVRNRLRDWDIARPRYWGTPVPVVHCEACGPVPVPVDELPVILPEAVDLEAPGNPLASCESFVHTRCPQCGEAGRRDTDTIETYASPWWFYLICQHPTDSSPFHGKGIEEWMPVDLMIGGADQTRTCFFHIRTMAEAMTRLGIVDERYPVKQLLAIGMVKHDGRKMSKSAGNAVDLAALLDRHGADVLRLAILSIAAPDQDINWNDELLRRASRFIGRVSSFFGRHSFAFGALPALRPGRSKRQRKLANWVETAERKLTGSLSRCAFHVAIQQVLVLFEQICKFEHETESSADADDRIALASAACSLLRLLAPLIPHVAENLWEQSGGQGLLAAAAWPIAVDRTRTPSEARG